jgi:uncharacterized protein (TIRG00374 family)
VTAPAHPVHEPVSPRRRIVRAVIEVAVMGIAFYFVLPKVIDAFSAFPQLSKVGIGWIVVVLACEGASFLMVWMLLRLATRTTQWLAIITSQLASNALSSVLPAGAAAGATLQVRMLSDAGIDATTAASGMTAFTLLQFATVAIVPVLLLPAVVTGVLVLSPSLWKALLVGAIALAGVLVAVVVLALFDAPLRAIGRAIQWTRNHVLPKRAPITGLPDRLIRERNTMAHTLGQRWRPAVLLSVGRVAFDYFALLASVAAVGGHPRPSLIVVAYVSSVVLALIPITPGGLGFVEAGLTGVLTLAGIGASQAVLATLLYRLAEYWLPMIAGPFAYALFRFTIGRRHEHRRATSATSGIPASPEPDQ